MFDALLIKAAQLRREMPPQLSAVIKPCVHAVNVALARKPQFVIIGTGRSGSTHISKVLNNSSLPCSHESYFTPDGPKLHNPLRGFYQKGDSSWLAIPFLPDPDILAIHQVRHPYKVIRSLYNMGFFDERYAEPQQPFVDFARRHFEFSDDPLRSCLRWYVEWNARCEAITDKRIAVEELKERLGDLEKWLGRKLVYQENKTPPDTNTRRPALDEPIDDVSEAIRKYPEYPELEAMAQRYGYTL